MARSLWWPRNRAAIEGSEWDIYAPPEDRERIAIATGGGITFHDVPVAENPGEILMRAMADHAKRCVDEGSAFLAVQPDQIFGDGSITAMVALAEENSRLCIAMPHPRVNADAFLESMPDGVLSNPQLVTIAMQHLHPSFATADLELEEVNCWLGGVAWRRLGTELYGVTCNAPTVFLARLTDEDVAFLESAPAGAWDHKWPSTLMGEQRQRLIGSSDAAFTVELTDPRTHIPKLRRKPPGAPYTYRFDLQHHKVNRNTVAVWRGLPSA